MSLIKTIKNLIIGRSKDPQDRNVFYHLSLVAFFAWVGLGADGLSSSCYGPEEAFLALGEHKYLGIFVAILSAITVFLISASYSQIIELFPSGGGGYLVASKLLSPTLGMISGCALLIDYVLTIAISIASGADALFSFLSPEWQPYRLSFALIGVFGLMLMNVRGVKESVIPLTPIFLIFVLTHFFAIVYSLLTHSIQLPNIVSSSVLEMQKTQSQVGLFGLVVIVLRAYSLGAGTFTGIEAISNGLPILREPKVLTGKKTMRYMAFSLAFTVAGLMIAYLLFDLVRQPGKTLNAVLFENMSSAWPAPWGQIFVLVTLISEAMLLFVAAQAGFLDGPRVLSNMALDRWMPSRFSSLSDRLVSKNGVLLMGVAAFLIVLATRGSVHILVVLYSITVFITFCLSQAGMVRHWWEVRKEERKWIKRILINGLGLTATTFILISMVILKFHNGGWISLLLTGTLVVLAILIKRHYLHVTNLLRRLNNLVQTASKEIEGISPEKQKEPPFDSKGKTAVLMVNGFNGLGLHTLFGVVRLFGEGFKNFVFVQIGVIDAGNFKGIREVDNLKDKVNRDLSRYVAFMKQNGYYAESFSGFGIDVITELEEISDQILQRFNDPVFFGGQLVFPEETFVTSALHNHTVFALQRRFYKKGIPFVLVPIRV